MVERNAMRSTRKQPFCWQEKKINRLIRRIYKEDSAKMSKMLLLYQTLTELDSDFNNQIINFYTKTISTYSGLSDRFIPKALKELEELNILKIIEKKDKGKFSGKELIFTPDEVIDPEEKKEALNKANSTDSRLSTNGSSTNGNSTNDSYASDESTTDKITTLEDNIQSENNNNKNNNIDGEKIKLLLNDNGIIKENVINDIIIKCNYNRVKEVVEECYKKERPSPAGFIIEACLNEYNFKNTKKQISDKYELKKKQDKLEEDKKTAQTLKADMNKKLIDDWIINNKKYYDSLIIQETEDYIKKNENSSFKPKDPSIIIKSNVRSFIKSDILDI